MLSPKQLVGVWLASDAVNKVGSAMVIVDIPVQPSSSVTVFVNVEDGAEGFGVTVYKTVPAQPALEPPIAVTV